MPLEGDGKNPVSTVWAVGIRFFFALSYRGGRREESRLYSVDGQQIRLDGWGWLILNEKAH